MDYPATLSDDLKYLSIFYKWSAEDKIGVRESFTGCAEMVRFYTVLAAAHRAGYTQNAGNGFIRLQKWCENNNLDDPFSHEFDLKTLDGLSDE